MAFPLQLNGFGTGKYHPHHGSIGPASETLLSPFNRRANLSISPRPERAAPELNKLASPVIFDLKSHQTIVLDSHLDADFARFAPSGKAYLNELVSASTTIRPSGTHDFSFSRATSTSKSTVIITCWDAKTSSYPPH